MPSKCFKIIFMFSLVVLIGASGKKLAPYIKVCSQSSPDFKKCCLDNGNAAVPDLAKGDKKLGIPSLLPLHLDSVDASPGPSLKILLKNLVIEGLGETRFGKIDIDPKTKMVRLEGGVPTSLRISGDYEVGGKILILPVEGKGTCNITGIHPTFEYDLKYTLEKINGEEYAKLLDADTFNFKVEGAYFHFDNLFNGDEKLGNNVNVFLNDNWQDVVKEMGGAIRDVIKTVAKTIANAVFKKVPFKHLLLP